MIIDIISVFPEFFDICNLSLFGKARKKELLEIRTHNLRDWTTDVHHSVDDKPTGGGAGMVMKPEIWALCLDDILGLSLQQANIDELQAPQHTVEYSTTDNIYSSTTLQAHSTSGNITDNANHSTNTNDSNKPSNVLHADLSYINDTIHHDVANITDQPTLIFPNPAAPTFTQHDAVELSQRNHLVFGCGRYEGYDSRVIQYYRNLGYDVREYAIGDYVLNGGEVATMVMLEAIVRLIPEFMGNPNSLVEESYCGDGMLLEHDQYTKPTIWREIPTPEVLISGHHARVERYRRDNALEKTSRIRPDIIEKLLCSTLNEADKHCLCSLGWDMSGIHPKHNSDIS